MKFGDEIDWDHHVDEIFESGARVIHETSDMAKTMIRMKKYITGGMKLIDCGCHIGRYCHTLIYNGFNYTGVDQSEKALKTARELNPGVKFIHSFLWDLDIKEEYDLAFFNAVLQHNTHEEKKKILPRIHRLLKDGGYVFMAESTEPIETKTQLTYEGWIELFESFGFEFVESWHTNPKGFHDNYLFRKVKLKCTE